MKKLIAPFLAVIMLATACSNETAKTETVTDEETTVTTAQKDSIKKVEVQAGNDGVNVSIKGATSIDISGSEGKVETKTGTDIQVNKKGVNVNTKDVRVKVGNRP